MKSFWTAFLLIFVAELGDKTQFMTLALSSRYKAVTILLGVSLGTMLVSLVSVALGQVLGNFLQKNWMDILAGLIFIIFGLLNLKHPQKEEADNSETIEKAEHWAWLSIAATFFIAELGDKTMLATLALASKDKNYLAIWAGSTFGLLLSNALAIIAGKTLSKYVNGRVVHFVSAAIYILAGLLSLQQGLMS